jgi:RNA polymerase sigma-70 factor (ECF subfamily)
MNSPVETTREADFGTQLCEQLDAVHAFARKLTGHEQDAEDLAHDALLRAVRFQDRYQPGTNLKSWLFRIVRNTFINRWRERQRRPQLEVAMEHFDFIAEARGADLEEIGQAPYLDPASACEDLEIGEAIEEAVEELSPKNAAVVRCCLVEGLTYTEAATELKLPAGTIMSRLHRGRRQLQERLADRAAEHGFERAA